jgi:hypothetical protein
MKTILGLFLALVLSVSAFADTPTSTPTPSATPSASPSPTITPTATPTFAPGNHNVYVALPVVTVVLPVPQTQNFTLPYTPAGPVSIAILDVTTNRWVTTGNIPFATYPNLFSVADVDPSLMAYSIVEPYTLRLRFGKRCLIFVPNRLYQVYAAYPVFVP